MEKVPLIKQFLQHQSSFMGYLIALTRDFDAAEEIFQNVAVIMMDTERHGDIRDFQAWTKEVLKRQALRYLQERRTAAGRVRAASPALLEGITQAFREGSASPEADRSELEALRRCISRLPEKSRWIIRERYEKRISFLEIAHALSTTEGAIQQALSRLRKSLRNCVRQHSQQAPGGY